MEADLVTFRHSFKEIIEGNPLFQSEDFWKLDMFLDRYNSNNKNKKIVKRITKTYSNGVWASNGLTVKTLREISSVFGLDKCMILSLAQLHKRTLDFTRTLIAYRKKQTWCFNLLDHWTSYYKFGSLDQTTAVVNGIIKQNLKSQTFKDAVQYPPKSKPHEKQHIRNMWCVSKISKFLNIHAENCGACCAVLNRFDNPEQFKCVAEYIDIIYGTLNVSLCYMNNTTLNGKGNGPLAYDANGSPKSKPTKNVLQLLVACQTYESAEGFMVVGFRYIENAKYNDLKPKYAIQFTFMSIQFETYLTSMLTSTGIKVDKPVYEFEETKLTEFSDIEQDISDTQTEFEEQSNWSVSEEVDESFDESESEDCGADTEDPNNGVQRLQEMSEHDKFVSDCGFMYTLKSQIVTEIYTLMMRRTLLFQARCEQMIATSIITQDIHQDDPDGIAFKAFSCNYQRKLITSNLEKCLRDQEGSTLNYSKFLRVSCTQTRAPKEVFLSHPENMAAIRQDLNKRLVLLKYRKEVYRVLHFIAPAPQDEKYPQFVKYIEYRSRLVENKNKQKTKGEAQMTSQKKETGQSI